MLSEQDMKVAALHMCRHYKKPDGTYPENAKQLRETVAWKQAEEKAAKTMSEAGMAVTQDQVMAFVFERLLRDSSRTDKLECHLVHPRAPRVQFQGKEKSMSDAVYVADPNGRIHMLESARVDETAKPGTPIIVHGDVSVTRAFGSTKKAKGEDEDEDGDSADGVAFDPPRTYYNITDNDKLRIELGGHDKPFPMGGPWVDGRIVRAARPNEKGSIFGRIGPSEYDGLSADEPFIAQCFVERAFLNEWDSGTFVSTICKTPGKAEVQVLHPIEALAESGHFPGIMSADRDSIQEFFENKPRFLAVGQLDLTREYTLSKMEGSEREAHEKLLSDLGAKGFLVDGKNGKSKYLDVSKNPKVKTTTNSGVEMEVPRPWVEVGERKYVNVRVYKNRNNELDAKFSVLADTPQLRCYEQKGTYDDGNEYHRGEGFQCVWLSGGGIQVPDVKAASRVTALFA